MSPLSYTTLAEAAMSEPVPQSIQVHFSNLTDPRIERRKLHPLINLITIALCGIICGAETWVDIENYGHAKYNWLAHFLDLAHGIPSHDTFGRVFARINPEQFQACFLSWIRAVFEVTRGQVIALDGKQLRRFHDQANGKAAIHMVSAWASANRLVLGQVKVNDKSNEITAIPELLQLLEISGCIVTLDAMGTQAAIAAQVIAQGADYVLALKANQGVMHQAVEELFHDALTHGFAHLAHDFYQTVDSDHGRIEIRRHWTTADIAWLPLVTGNPLWAGTRSLGMIQAERRVGEVTTLETRYYLSSLSSNAAQLAHAARSHWGIENAVHWVLDVAFGEDHCRIRKDHAPQNFAVLRHVALNLLRQETSARCGIKAKRLKSAWDNDYLLKVLSG
jgi:predicted transposase YbfD/YdcC